MKKENEIKDIHQIELLEKYYEVDRENRVITFKLYYDKASDVLDMRSSLPGREMFNNNVLDDVVEKLNRVPSDFKASIEFIIEDLEGYDPKVLSERFNDLLELNNYHSSRKKKIKFLTSTILILIGILILYVNSVLKIQNVFPEGIGSSVFHEVLSISAWVFIWQAVTILFLTPSELSLKSLKILRNIVMISFSNYDNSIVYVKSKEEIIESLVSESKYVNFVRILFLVISGVFFVLGGSNLYYLVSGLISLKNAEGISSNIIVLMVLVFSIGTLISLIQLVIGFIGLFKYIGYKNFFVKLLLPLTIISGVISLVGFVFSIIYGTGAYDIVFQLVQLILISFYIYIIIVFDKLTVFKERKNNSSGDSNGNK